MVQGLRLCTPNTEGLGSTPGSGNYIPHSATIGQTTLVVQWLRICLSMQGTQVQSLVWEDYT